MATHASEHNSVNVKGLTDLQTQRRDKVAKRQKRASKASAKKVNMKSEVNVEHEPAFMTQLAIYDVEAIDGNTIVGSVVVGTDYVTVRAACRMQALIYTKFYHRVAEEEVMASPLPLAKEAMV